MCLRRTLRRQRGWRGERRRRQGDRGRNEDEGGDKDRDRDEDGDGHENEDGDGGGGGRNEDKDRDTGRLVKKFLTPRTDYSQIKVVVNFFRFIFRFF